jgi:hypothetical protein
MSEFVEPKGINFSSVEDLSATELSEALSKIVGFIQRIDLYKNFEQYADWREHDGLHSHRNSIGFEELRRIVGSPTSLSAAMPGDFDVFIGIAPPDNSWYLRFYLNDEDKEIIARFDVTFSNPIAARFKQEVLNKLDISLKERDAKTYYRSIIQ